MRDNFKLLIAFALIALLLFLAYTYTTDLPLFSDDLTEILIVFLMMAILSIAYKWFF